jgi:hypothetical protein
MKCWNSAFNGQCNEILLNLGMKCWNLAFNGQCKEILLNLGMKCWNLAFNLMDNVGESL